MGSKDAGDSSLSFSSLARSRSLAGECHRIPQQSACPGQLGPISAAAVLPVAGSSMSAVGFTMSANRVDSVQGKVSMASPLNSWSSSSQGMGW